MFSNVLVGVNGEESGRDAVALARTLVAEDGELTFSYVFHDPSPGPSVPGEYERGRDLLEMTCAESGIEANILPYRASSVGRGLHELAETIRADLLVVGSSQRGLFGRVRLRGDTRAALNGAPCMVAIAPAGYGSEAPALMSEIGVGYDGSPESEHALGVARTLSAEYGSRLSAFEAVSIPAHIHRGADRESIRDIVSRARERIGALGGVEPHATYGDPVEELTLYSASLDLLVIGSRDYGPLGRLLYGSTAEKLASTARCPLLVLTRSGRGASTDAAATQAAAVASTATSARERGCGAGTRVRRT
jgi:nucleotide-binding universal stress UspA family protein